MALENTMHQPTLFLCRICGQKRTDEGVYPTNPLAQATYDGVKTLLGTQSVRVELTDCLSVCTRPLAWALVAEGKHTFTFAAQDAVPSPAAFKELAQTYARLPVGDRMTKAMFPVEMKGTLVSRVPPLPKA